jgi:hypothetical protein
MDNSIIVQSIKGFSVLQGEINYAPSTTTAPVQNILVISDDNSGSMGAGSRKTCCIKKSQRLIEGCETTNTPCIFTT